MLFDELSIDVLSEIWYLLVDFDDLLRITTLTGSKQLRLKFERNTLGNGRGIACSFLKFAEHWLSNVRHVTALDYWSTVYPTKPIPWHTLRFPDLRELRCKNTDVETLMTTDSVPSHQLVKLHIDDDGSPIRPNQFCQFFGSNLGTLNFDVRGLYTVMSLFSSLNETNLSSLEHLKHMSFKADEVEHYHYDNDTTMKGLINSNIPRKLETLKFEGLYSTYALIYALANRETLEDLHLSFRSIDSVQKQYVDALTCSQYLLNHYLDLLTLLRLVSKRVFFACDTFGSFAWLSKRPANDIVLTLPYRTVHFSIDLLNDMSHLPELRIAPANFGQLAPSMEYIVDNSGILPPVVITSLSTLTKLSLVFTGHKRVPFHTISTDIWHTIVTKAPALVELNLGGTATLVLEFILPPHTDYYYYFYNPLPPPTSLTKFTCSRLVWESNSVKTLTSFTSSRLLLWTREVLKDSRWFKIIDPILDTTPILLKQNVANCPEFYELDDSLVFPSIFGFSRETWKSIPTTSMRRLHVSNFINAFFHQSSDIYFGHQRITFTFPSRLTHLNISAKPQKEGQLFYIHQLPATIEVLEAPYAVWDMLPAPKHSTNQGKRSVVNFDDDEDDFDEEGNPLKTLPSSKNVHKSSSSDSVTARVVYDDSALTLQTITEYVKLAERRMVHIKSLFVHSVYPLQALRGLGVEVSEVRIHKSSASRVIADPVYFSQRMRGPHSRVLKHQPRLRYDYDPVYGEYEKFVPSIEVLRRPSPSLAAESVTDYRKKAKMVEIVEQ